MFCDRYMQHCSVIKYYLYRIFLIICIFFCKKIKFNLTIFGCFQDDFEKLVKDAALMTSSAAVRRTDHSCNDNNNLSRLVFRTQDLHTNPQQVHSLRPHQ